MLRKSVTILNVQMPPVTNTPAPHIPGTTATANQLPKNYGSHQGYVAKG